MPQVQIIEAFDPRSSEKEAVAAYCRVSTEKDDQIHSYRAQITYYTNLIAQNPDWELADVYADEGLSGTRADKRDEFQRMLADCRAGKIRRILVKSISRFARNNMELLEVTRELKSLGVTVYFEEQHIDTSQILGEMQLNLYANAAQEESTSIAKNMTWSIRKRMESGEYIGTTAPYGFRMIEGRLAIDPIEAEIIRTIFAMYLSGLGQLEIAKRLNDQGIPSGTGGKWSKSSVQYTLLNERYMGDVLLQKRYTVDTLAHYVKKNKGELPQYYVHKNHQGIVSRETFQRAQELFQRKQDRRVREMHTFVHRIQCPDCGAWYREVTCSGKHYWSCPKQINGLADCVVHRIPEEKIKECFLNMVWKLHENVEEILPPTIALLREITMKTNGTDRKLCELNQAILSLNDKMLTLNRMREKGYLGDEEFRVQSAQLSARRQELSYERRKHLHGSVSQERIDGLDRLLETVRSWNQPPTEFALDFFDSLIEKIIPTADKLCFHFHCGLELTEVLPK